MTDGEILAARESKDIILDPFDPDRLEPASYDIRVGTWAFTSSVKEKLDLSRKGVLIIDAGEFAVLEARERIELSPIVAGQLGLRSEYARRGLLMLSGPQVDPTFRGILVVRLVNLSPKPIALSYEAPFLTVQFFRLNKPVENSYNGPQQGQTGISSRDMQELAETEGLTLGQVIKTLSTLAMEVAELKGSVNRLVWLVPFIVAFGIAVIGVLVTVKH